MLGVGTNRPPFHRHGLPNGHQDKPSAEAISIPLVVTALDPVIPTTTGS